MEILQLLDRTLTPHTLKPLSTYPRPYPLVSPSPAPPCVCEAFRTFSFSIWSLITPIPLFINFNFGGNVVWKQGRRGWSHEGQREGQELDNRMCCEFTTVCRILEHRLSCYTHPKLTMCVGLCNCFISCVWTEVLKFTCLFVQFVCMWHVCTSLKQVEKIWILYSIVYC